MSLENVIPIEILKDLRMKLQHSLLGEVKDQGASLLLLH